MSLGLAIPVHNDADRLARLLDQVAEMAIFDQVVVVDDGSDVPVRVPRHIAPEIVLHRHETPRGAGVARNHALDQVTTDHVAFIDSDDSFTYEFPDLWRDLAGRHFDFCLFRHHDSRQEALGQWGMPGYDDALWRDAGMGGYALRALDDPDALAALARTANYPWNKIYRRRFLADHDIRCDEIPVHGDILPHWLSFLNARDVLVSDRVAIRHEVTEGAGRLTNLKGPERLLALRRLLPLLTRLRAARGAGHPLVLGFIQFVDGLLDWIWLNSDPALHPALRTEIADILKVVLDDEMRAALEGHDPVLAARLQARLAQTLAVDAPPAGA